jgi:hypothetical protein
MGAPRRFVGALLRAVLRLAPIESRDWALAMLRELDFIEGEWAALFWGLGSSMAILRHAASGWRGWFRSKSNQEAGMNTVWVGPGRVRVCRSAHRRRHVSRT